MDYKISNANALAESITQDTPVGFFRFYTNSTAGNLSYLKLATPMLASKQTLSTHQRAESHMAEAQPPPASEQRATKRMELKANRLLLRRLIDSDPDLVHAISQWFQFIRKHDLEVERLARLPLLTLLVRSARHALLLLGLFSYIVLLTQSRRSSA